MEDYPRIKEMVETVEDQDLLKRGGTDWSAEASKGIKTRTEGGYYWGPAPFGYRSVKGLLEIVPEEAKVVRYIFEVRKEGKSTGEIAKDPFVRKTKPQVREMLRNPVYKGEVRYGGRLIPGKHQAIVTKDLWEACQPLTEGRWSCGVPPFGYKWFRGLLIVDPEKAPIVEKIFDLRLKGQTIHQIVEATGLSQTPIQKMWRLPTVCGKKLDAKGNTIDGGWEPIIPYSKWLAARGIRRKEEWYAKTGEIQRQKGLETARLILERLPATRKQLVHAITSRSPSCVRLWIRRLLQEHKIEEQPDGTLKKP